MDVDKLSLKPTEIDKNTGRIVLPKSQEELARLSGYEPVEPKVQTNVKTYLQSGPRPAFPRASASAAPQTPSQVRTMASPDPTGSAAFYMHPFFGILGFCALVAALPVAFFGANLVRENDQLTRDLSSLETQNAILNARNTSSSTDEYRMAALQQEINRMRSDVAQLGTGAIDLYYEEDVPVYETEAVSDFPNSTEQEPRAKSDPSNEFADSE